MSDNAIPDWKVDIAERYGHLLNNTGGNDPVELLEDLERNPRMASTNIVRFALAMAVSSQITLLNTLETEGLLDPTDVSK